MLNVAHVALSANMALIFANEISQRLFIRGYRGIPNAGEMVSTLPLSGSRTERVVASNRPDVSNDLGGEYPDDTCEVTQLMQRSYYAYPVRDPLGVAVGAAFAMKSEAHIWTKEERDLVEGTAYLISLNLLLRASMETIRLMSNDIKHKVN